MRRVGLGILLAALCCTACSGGDNSAISRSSRPSTTTSTAARATTAPSTTAPRGGLEIAIASWQLPAPVSRELMLSDGSSLFVLGGLDARKVSSPAVYRIDPSGGRATQVATLDPPVHDAAGVRFGDRSLVIGGGTPPARATVQVVAPGAATRALGQIPQPRADLVAAAVGGMLYVLGGGDEASALVAEVDASTDGARWTAAGTLAEPVRYPAVIVVDGAIYLFGGVTTSEGTDTRSVQRYDPKTRTTEVVAQLPAPLSHASAVLLGGRVYVLGGFVDNQVSAQVLAFDPGSRKLTTAGTLPAAVTDAAAVTIGDTAYLAGGQGTDRAPVATVVSLHG